MTDSSPARGTWGRAFLRLLKPLLFIIVAIGIGHSVRLAWIDLETTQAKVYRRIIQLERELVEAAPENRSVLEAEIAKLEKSQFSLTRIDWTKASCSIVIAFLALIPPGVFWWQTLRKFGYRVPFFAAQATFAMGNLGKYVPGKMMVLVLRSGGMLRWNVPISTSLVTIFIETLTALAVGSALGGVTLMALQPPPWLFWTSVAATVAAIVPTAPPIFRQVVNLLSRYRRLKLPQELATAMNWRLILCGWLWMSIGWLGMGTSLWVICEAIRDSTGIEASIPSIPSVRLWWISVSAACLGFVIGFLSMLPGGAGVREVVVTMLLAPALGYAPALVAAVIYRITNLIAELSMAGLTWFLNRHPVLQTEQLLN